MGNAFQPGTKRFVVALVCGLFLAGCAPAPKPESPVSVDTDLPRDSRGEIDFARLERQLTSLRAARKHSATRPCKGTTSNCLVTVSVEELEDSWELDPAKGPGRRRYIGRWTNEDDSDTEGRYDLLPKSTYYVWIKDAPYNAALNSATKWGILRLGHGSVEKGYVVRCVHQGFTNKTSALDFYYCPTSPTKDERYLRSSSAPAPHSVASFARFSSSGESADASTSAGETWFECDPGCCTGTTAN